jgi:D-amino peptidase
MRIYISADIEGIAGVVSRENLMPGRFEYEQARDWMTRTVLVACETARELGAEEVIVSDSHGNGQNIRFERMPEYVQLVRSWPRPLGMMQGVDMGSFSGALLLGYHAGATNPQGTLSHTISGEHFNEVRLNGAPVSEAIISAAIAGHFGVPVLMIAGDDIVVQETRASLGDIAQACLKTSLGWLSAMNVSPQRADALVREAIRDGIGRVGSIAPFVLPEPLTLEIHLRNRFMAEWLSYLDGVVRLDAHTIRHSTDNILGVSRFLEFVSAARTVLG